jgi:hypothetical protein
VALARALWEVMHVHALCRKLAKPFKVACALRNVLLVADVPLYARWVLGEKGGAGIGDLERRDVAAVERCVAWRRSN